ncbi:MAG: diguanylate cyclase [Alishewanella sp.]|nr:diguanylate cyclase [Alishewanella sp.]MDP5035225.1 diguanylate cyclase [Alishewanella sp.]
MLLSGLCRHRRHVYHFFCFLLCTVFFNTAAASAAKHIPSLDNYFKETLNTRSGLPHNTINAITQTPDGYMWFGTWEGVARYNGREFRIFDRNPQTGLPDVGVRTFHLDKHNVLWIGGARGGLVKVQDGQWQAFPPFGELINRLFMDNQDRLWVATEGQGLYMQDATGKRTHFTLDDGLPSLQIHSLQQDANGLLWVGTANGLVYLDAQLQIQPVAADEFNGVPIFALELNHQAALLVGTERGLYLAQPSQSKPLTLLDNVPVSAILQENSDILWIGTIDRGLLRLHNGITESLDMRQGLPNNRILALLKDKEGNLWVGTNGGIFRLRDAPFNTMTTEVGLAGNYTRALLSHSNGCMYVGSSRGLTRICNGAFSIIDLTAVSVGQSVLSLAEGPDQTVLVGTYADGLIELQHDQIRRHYDTGNGLPANEVRAILPLGNGQMWVGTSNGVSLIKDDGILSLGVADGLPSSFVVSLFQTPDQRIFIGTGNGVAVYENEQLRTLNIAAYDDAHYAFGMTYDAPVNILWITTDRGLMAYHLASNDIQIIGRAQGMPFDKIFELVQDQQGSFWISSNRGILRLNRSHALALLAGKRSSLSVELYGESDGMISSQANGGSAKAGALHHDGSVWFATSMGVTRVQPERLQQFAEIAPPVVIEKVHVDGQALPLGSPVNLVAGSNRLEISYAGLGFVMSGRIQYRTKLEGFDRDWVARGTANSAEYTNLPPGEYRFLVSASYPDGEWSKQEAVYTFTLLPHLWQRWWFKFAIILLLTTLSIIAVRWRMSSLRHTEQRLRKLVAEQTTELQLLARQDALTGLANRRAFDEELQHEYQRAQRNNTTLCLALIDVDHFKRVNDQLSHAVGDEVLKRLAEVLKQQCRTVDLLARWGGEEFVVLLPDTSLQDASEVCERLRHKVEKLNFTDLAADLHITISIGLTTNNKLELPQLLVSADKALYNAKKLGRNRLALADNTR